MVWPLLSGNDKFLMKSYLNFTHSSSFAVLLGGVFIGLIQTLFAISIAALIYSGRLSQFLGAGIGMMLMGYAVLSVLIAKRSSLLSSICSIQEAPAILLMTIVNDMVFKNPTLSDNDLFVLVAGVVIASTLMTGVFFYFLGLFKLGDLVRYTPYPVIAGFLAGTGWIMVQGGVELILGGHDKLSIANLLSEEYLAKWLAGVFLGLILFIILKRYKNILLLPIIVLLGIGLFYLTMAIQGFSIEEIRTQGWLLVSISDIYEKNLALANVSGVDWKFVLMQIGSGIPAMIVVSTMAFLLNINAIEILTKQDIDLDQSLKVTGIANCFAALCGSTVGFISVDMTSLSYRMNMIGRSVGLLTALTTIVVLFFCFPILRYFPGFIIGGFLIYIGLDFLHEWIYEVWFKINKVDYVILVVVMIVIVSAGFIQGLAVGIIIVLLQFSVNYSNVSIVKNSLTGSELQSSNQRGEVQQQLLIDEGAQIQLFMLTGFVYFGTANKLRVQLIERNNSIVLPPLKYILLDWRQVTGIDSSTIYSLQKIQQLAIVNSIQLVFTNVPENIKAILDNNLLESDLLKYFLDINCGLDWCENKILMSFNKDNVFLTFENVFIDSDVDIGVISTLKKYFERKDMAIGDYLIRQGDAAESMYFIESGCMEVFFETDGGEHLHIQRISTGLFVGEIGLLLKQPRTASIKTTKASVVYEITSINLELMKKESIEAYAEFERVLALLLAKRLFIADARVRRLL